MRLQWEPAGKIRLLNDAYNANPNSMRAALETVAMLSTNSRRILILGDMKELGQSSERYHREIGQYIATAKAFDQVVCVGPDAGWIAESAIAAGFSAENIARFDNSPSASTAIPPTLREGDLVLLKGSRSVHLEKVAKAITQTQDVPMRMVAS